MVHGATGRRAGFGRLAAAAAALPVPKEPRLKERSELTLVGKPVRRVDGPAIVSGRAGYGLDVRIPGMRFAAVARCPVAGGKARRFDAAKARAVPGVRKVLEVSTGVAVVADDTWSAMSGRDALRGRVGSGRRREPDDRGAVVADRPRLRRGRCA